MKRYNLAVERLQAAKEKWYEKTVEKKNKVALLRQRLNDANKDLDDTNEALHNLRTAMDENVGPEPTLTRLLRTVRRHENAYERRRWRYGIGSGSFSKQNVIVIS